MALPEPHPAHERRISFILIQYWNAIRGERELPREEDIDPDQLIGIWERCFLVQVRDIENNKDFNYSYLGPDLIEAYQAHKLESSNTNMVGPEANRLASMYMRVIEERGPLMDENEFYDQTGQLVKYRQVFMPLSTNGTDVDAILGGSWFRLY